MVKPLNQNLSAEERIAELERLLQMEKENLANQKAKYNIVTEIGTEKAYCRIFKNDECIGFGYGFIKGDMENLDVSIAQAASYATHMAFKDVQGSAEKKSIGIQ